MIYNYHVVATHVSGVSNVIPDFLSRINQDGVKTPDCRDLCCFSSIGSISLVMRRLFGQIVLFNLLFAV